MEKEEYTFLDPEGLRKKTKNHADAKPLETVLIETRRVDDALLHALSLVLSSNSEYARSVSALLENDLEREKTIDHINSKAKELLEQTKELVDSQNELAQLLSTFTKEYKGFIEAMLASTNEKQQDYMDIKFSALFTNLGLRADGSEYSPTDKLIVKFKNVLSQQLWVLAAGAFIYHVILLLAKKYGGA